MEVSLASGLTTEDQRAIEPLRLQAKMEEEEHKELWEGSLVFLDITL